jgi:hypothetical protein
MAERKRFLLRVDPRLYDVLQGWSADELRSVNAQIEYLLVDAAKRAGRWPRGEPAPLPPQRGGRREPAPGGEAPGAGGASAGSDQPGVDHAPGRDDVAGTGDDAAPGDAR